MPSARCLELCIVLVWLSGIFNSVSCNVTYWDTPTEEMTNVVACPGGNATFEWIYHSPDPHGIVKCVNSNGDRLLDFDSSGTIYTNAPYHMELYCPNYNQGENDLYCVTVRMTQITPNKEDIYSCVYFFPGGLPDLDPREYNMTVCNECPLDINEDFPSVIVNPGSIKLERRDVTIEIVDASNAQIEIEVPETNCNAYKVIVKAYLDDEHLGDCSDSTSSPCTFALTVDKTKKVNIEYHFPGWAKTPQNISFKIEEKAPKALWQCLAALIEGIVSIVFNVIVIIICILIIRGKLRHPLVKEIPTNTGGNGNVNETANQKSIIWVKLKPMVLFIIIIVVFAILFILGMLFFALCPDKEDDLAAIVVAVICIVLFLVAVVLLMVVFMKRTSSCSEKTMDSDNIRSPSPVTVSNVAVTTSSPHSLSAKPSSQQNTPRHTGGTVTPPLRLPGTTSKTVESSRGRPLPPLSSPVKPNAVSPDKNAENGDVDNKKKKKKKKKKKQRGESKDDDNDGDVY